MLLAVGPAHAADSRSFDLDHLQRSITGGDFFATESAGRMFPWQWRAGASYRFDDRPLTLVQPDGTRAALVDGRSLLEVSGALAFTRWVAVVPRFDGSSCTSGNPYTTGDFCMHGTCEPGPGTVMCPSMPPCTMGVCDPTVGCTVKTICDMAMPPDMSMPPDLAAPPDLTALPDLLPAPDLMSPPI